MKIKNEYHEYLATKFDIAVEDIVNANAGICYNSITVKTIEAAAKVKAQCHGTVNGGWYDGMALGNIEHRKDGTFYIMW